MRPSRAAALALSCALLLAAAARATPVPSPRQDPKRLLPAHLTVALASGALILVGASLQPYMAPATCRWCEGNSLDDAVRGGLRWSSTGTAGTISNLTGFVVAPLAALVLPAIAGWREGQLDDALVDTVVILETAGLTMMLNQAVKVAVGRERPFVHALAAGDKPLTDNPSDNNLSFYSGHTAFAFSVAVAAGTSATLRRSRWAPWVWAVGLAAAAATGYLRIAADKHYLSDVLVGAAVGSAAGVLVPLLHHRLTTRAVALSPTALPGGGGLQLAGRF